MVMYDSEERSSIIDAKGGIFRFPMNCFISEPEHIKLKGDCGGGKSVENFALVHPCKL